MIQLFWKAVWQFLKKLNVVLLYDPGTPLLGVYAREWKTDVHCGTFIWMVTAYRQNMKLTLIPIS